MDAIPIYKKSEVAYASIKEGDHSLEEFEKYLQELILTDSMNDTATGIAKLVLNNGTESLTEKQINALQFGMKEYKMANCTMCNAVVVVGLNDEEPFFCDMHE